MAIQMGIANVVLLSGYTPSSDSRLYRLINEIGRMVAAMGREAEAAAGVRLNELLMYSEN